MTLLLSQGRLRRQLSRLLLWKALVLVFGKLCMFLTITGTEFDVSSVRCKPLVPRVMKCDGKLPSVPIGGGRCGLRTTRCLKRCVSCVCLCRPLVTIDDKFSFSWL